MRRLFLLPTLLSAVLAIQGCTTQGSGANSTSPAPASVPSSDADPEPADTSVSSFANTQRALRDGSGITPYPFDTCAVQWHKPFKDGVPKYRRVYRGQEVLLCCTPCMRAFDTNPEPYMPRIYAEVEAQGLEPGMPSRYPKVSRP